MPINERNIFWDWSNLAQQVNLARYVQEELDDIAKIVKEAEDDLKQIPPWYDPSFDAYVSGNPDRVRAQVKALFQRLQNGKPKSGKYLTYRVEPPDSRKGRQRLRLAREILHNGHSECIGWALLLAACVLHACLNPLIIVTKNKRTGEVHAMPGYWLAEQYFPQVVVGGKDVGARLEHEIEVVNATRIAVDEYGHKRSFEQAKEEAHERLLPPKNPDWEIVFAVDLRKAREEGIEPLLPLEPWSGNHPLPTAEHFQCRPELEDVRKWWQDENSHGVLALIGIGGAGKTALVHRFLAQLPNSDIKERGVDKDETLPIPDALFVWSFYEHPDVDRCATALYNYLSGERVAKATFEQVQEVLSENWRGCRALLVFDGVEKLQISAGIEPEEEGGTFGQFLPEGAPLGRFLSWCCDGPRPAHVLITSRFGLTELRGYRAVDLRDLPLESARALLRAHGVKGLDWQLDELIREFGSHAQTLDLLGNVLRRWCNGDPTRVRELPSLEDVKKLADVRDKVWGRVRVLRFYEERLPKETLRLLQLLCAFEVMPVDAGTLTGVACLVAKSAPDTFGMLTGFSSLDVKGHLISLEYEYHLAHSTIGKGGSRTYFAHRAIQDYFWDRLPQNAKDVVHRGIADFLVSLGPLASLVEGIKRLEDAARLARGKESIVYFTPIEETHLDKLQELLHHLVKANDLLKLKAAWDLYFFGMGAFERLGVKLGFYSRGERLVRLFADVQLESLSSSIPRTGIPLDDLQSLLGATWAFHKLRSEFLNERGIYAFSLGELRTAVTSYHEAVELAVELKDLKNVLIYCANLCEGYFVQGRLPKAVSVAAYGLEITESGVLDQPLTTYRGDKTWVAGESGHTLLNRPELFDQLWILSSYAAYALALSGQCAPAKERFIEALQYFYLASTRPELVATSAALAPLVDALGGQLGIAPLDLGRLALSGKLYSIAGVYEAAWMVRLGNMSKAYDILTDNRNICEKIELNRDVFRCDLLLGEVRRLQREFSQARESLARALDWGKRTGDQEVLVLGNLISARLALDTGGLNEAEQAIREGLRIAEYCGYGLYWIDLQVVKGQWELTCGRQLRAGKELQPELGIWTPQQWFERTEASALQALNGQLKDSDKPAPRPDLPEDQLAMLGARHPECGYAWGEGDALHLLGEALFTLAQCVGPGGHDSKGRSYAELLEKARQATEEALALRQRIQDPKAKETEDLLARLEREHETG